MAKLYLLSLGVVFLAWLVNENIPLNRPPLVSYDSSIFYGTEILTPSTKNEVIQMVRSASDNGRKIRMVGTGHSWSRVAVSEDLQLSLEKYKGLVDLDKERNLATFRAGTTFHEVNAVLEANGLALSVLGSISEQTLAGAISTGTHGTGIKFGNLATMVTHIELITANGEILSLSVNENKDTFKAAQVSIGLLGVIVELTFRVEPEFNLREVAHIIPLDDCLDNMDAIITGSEHVKMWVELYTSSCFLFQLNRTSEAPRDNPNPQLETVQGYGFEVVSGLASWLPRYARGIITALFTYLEPLPPHDRVDSSHRVFNIPGYFPIHHEGELVVPVSDCPTAVRRLQSLVLNENIPLNYIVEVRFVKGDDIWMSPNYQRDSCHLTLCIYNPSEETKRRYLYGSYQALLEYKPRVHWGKYFDLSRSELEEMYPKLGEFLELRARLDPAGLFVNRQLAKTFGLEHLL